MKSFTIRVKTDELSKKVEKFKYFLIGKYERKVTTEEALIRALMIAEERRYEN